jgi:phospholipase D
MTFMKKHIAVFLFVLVAFFTVFSDMANCEMTLESKSKDITLRILFIPGDNGTEAIVNEINKATSTIYMQAFAFTCRQIYDAIIKKLEENVRVYIILDAGQAMQKYSVYSDLDKARSESCVVLIDKVAGYAHNKIIIIDSETVITGSFNFSKGAQQKNTENIVIIRNKQIAEVYLKNFLVREAKSYKTLHILHADAERARELKKQKSAAFLR